jgi:hypothetical protein
VSGRTNYSGHWALNAPYSRGTIIRVVLAEDTYLVREGIQRLLEPGATAARAVIRSSASVR